MLPTPMLNHGSSAITGRYSYGRNSMATSTRRGLQAVVTAVAVGTAIALSTGQAHAASGVTAAPTCNGYEANIVGTPGSDTLTGTDNADVIFADAGNDVVFGLGEADIVCLGPGNDTFNGGAGDDLIVVDAAVDGADNVSGGPGRDLVDYSARTTPVTVTVDSVADDGAPGEGDTTNPDVELLEGGSAGDTLTGSPSNTFEDIRGNEGNDTITSGAGGSSQLVGGPGNDTLRARAGAGDVSLFGSDGADTLFGGPGNDILNGQAEADVMVGGLGNDLVIGGAGDDQSIAESTSADGADEFRGGADIDTMSYSARNTPVAVSPDGRADDGAVIEGDNVNATVENIRGGQAGDFLYGNALANRLFGGTGSDTIRAVDGISGNDVVDGAQGSGTDECTADPGDIISNCP
ncbi:calcium-binding protein [Streptomyces phyllanthi]|uniref:calcium-binding protein n=1 Tax=Streptomyces phyllanthi TaxID=1803180 RepID=UPI0018836E6A|nr:calcium-binding protein [Streptomyces phyllanthi]